MGRMYSASFEGVAVTAVQDFFEVSPAANKPVAVHGLYLSQSSDTGDAAEEILRVLMQRVPATVTSGSGGSTPTVVPLNANSAAAGAVVEANNTTGATSTGTIVNLHAEAFNIRVGMAWIPTPEMRPIVKNAEVFIVELMAAPADSLTMSGTIYLEELA